MRAGVINTELEAVTYSRPEPTMQVFGFNQKTIPKMHIFRFNKKNILKLSANIESRGNLEDDVIVGSLSFLTLLKTLSFSSLMLLIL